MAKVLGLSASEPLDLKQGFFELGMDSLTSAELRNRLQNSLACFLPPTIAFDYPTLEALVEYLSRMLSVAEKPDAEARRLGIAGPFYTAEFDFHLTPASSAQATVMDAQQRLAALGARV